MRSEKPRFLSRTEIGTLAASALAICVGLSYAGPSPHMMGSLFGLAPAQTVRVSLASNDTTIRGDNSLPPDPCYAQVKIFAADGSIAALSSYQKVKIGSAFSQDFKYDELVGPVIKAAQTDFTNRVQLRAVSYLSSTGLDGIKGEQKVDGCMGDVKMLKLSVEIFDNASGRTSFMVPTESLLPAVQ